MLIVDDELFNLETFRRLLSNIEIKHVDMALDGIEAI